MTTTKPHPRDLFTEEDAVDTIDTVNSQTPTVILTVITTDQRKSKQRKTPKAPRHVTINLDGFEQILGINNRGAFRASNVNWVLYDGVNCIALDVSENLAAQWCLSSVD